MGQIYRLDIETSQIRKLTSAPLYFTSKPFPQPELPERELYSDVEVLPDSRFFAFAVHSVADNDSDDIVGLSGPLAVMDLLSGKARVLSSTEKINDEYPPFATGPRWSNDGKKLLMVRPANAQTVRGRERLAKGLVVQQGGSLRLGSETEWYCQVIPAGSYDRPSQ
jgi:Tol biopolymer transport system component